MNKEDAIRLMERHATAWNAHDIDGLLKLLTADCVYDASAGPHAYGERYVGEPALRKAFAAIWAGFPNARWDEVEHSVCGDHGFSTWTFRGTNVSGQRTEVKGLDHLRFRDGRICYKDTFRKNVTSR
jgi:hypothetical protein